MPRQLLLLLPEDTLDYLPASLVGPEYAAIVDDSEEDRVGLLFVTVDGQDSGDAHDPVEDAQVFVPRIRANHCRVWEGEQAMGAPDRFLRRPAFAMTEGRPIYGQAVSYKGSEVTIRHGDESTVVAAVDVEEVAPIIVLLLDKTTLVHRLIMLSALHQAHTRILNRLLGTPGAPATRVIRRLLSGVAPVSAHPRPTDEPIWMSPLSGRDKMCSMRHVIGLDSIWTVTKRQHSTS
ncbi:hypothetical protein PC129_g23130 [Phytophthora cactorum]|uniref:Uncharacterized protein n=1 Tax=Phytophthora cactorum TaxID=29920 RepID=A0A329RAV6_9STRA|nr:hypothetical protein Pcac1_g5688 [Phytophthora cactorum]KAG2792930.1 hypothetical protein PC111_g23250 [Phytophthora cactorum]KAG2794136.1 hypothetical protein PC112_g23156 [Phytophthora cactorum]KAG2830640.1 hypothetical protein PC113_g21072 [Phytophthora cactorum]KAG2873841.1 hypothetical protein PC114_g25630 [Phytophthora cactorum]